MSVLDTLPAPIVQMGHVEKIVEQQQNQAHKQLMLAQDEAAAQIAKDKQRIEENEKPDTSRRVRDRQAEKERRGASDSRKKKEAGADDGGQNPEDGGSEPERSANPWAGNLLNVKI